MSDDLRKDARRDALGCLRCGVDAGRALVARLPAVWRRMRGYRSGRVRGRPYWRPVMALRIKKRAPKRPCPVPAFRNAGDHSASRLRPRQSLLP